MTKEQKVIRAKVGLLEPARRLGNVSQACNMVGFRNGPCGVKSRVSTSPINGAPRERAFHEAP
jgi:hypothetical protein